MNKSHIPGPGEQVIPSAENLIKALLLFALLFAAFFLAERGAAWFDAQGGGWPLIAGKWLWIGLLAIADVILLIGMGILAHDAVHRVLFRSGFWNEYWGGVLSAMALIPFHANRQFHLTHHSTAHQPGLDPENAMHNRPFLQAATLGSVIALLEQYRYFLNNLRRVAELRYAARVLMDAALMGAALAFYFWVVPRFGLSLAHTVLPLLAVFPLVFAWRALSDHYAVPAIERPAKKKVGDVYEVDAEAWHQDRERRQREVTGWVVLTHPWLEWLWSHVNYHEVHHKYPWLSHRYLKPVFAATRDRQPYLVVNGYWNSLLNLRRRKYYATRAEMRPFLSTPDW